MPILQTLEASPTPAITLPTTTRRIILTGFMGAGKSTIGRILAQRLGWSFLDLDHHLEQRAQAHHPRALLPPRRAPLPPPRILRPRLRPRRHQHRHRPRRRHPRDPHQPAPPRTNPRNPHRLPRRALPRPLRPLHAPGRRDQRHRPSQTSPTPPQPPGPLRPPSAHLPPSCPPHPANRRPHPRGHGHRHPRHPRTPPIKHFAPSPTKSPHPCISPL